MLKYIKYFFPAFITIILLFSYLQGRFYPTIFLLIFSFTIIIGDLFIKDSKVQKFYYPNLLNMSIYINLPILFILVFFYNGDIFRVVQKWCIKFSKTPTRSFIWLDCKEMYSKLWSDCIAGKMSTHSRLLSKWSEMKKIINLELHICLNIWLLKGRS